MKELLRFTRLPRVVTYIVRYYMDVSEKYLHRRNQGWQPIHDAALLGDVAGFRSLISQGADVAATTNDGLSVLHCAAASYDPEKVVYCVEEAGMNIHSKNNKGWQPIHEAARYGGGATVLRYLISKGANVAAVTDDGRSVVHLAAASSNMWTVEYCVVEAGMSIHSRDNNGVQPIHYAAMSYPYQERVLRYLISKGADVTATTNNDASVLHFAAAGGNIDTVQYCVEKAEINIHSRNNQGWQAIHEAARYRGGSPVLRYLISKGADVAATANNGRSVLHFAAASGDEWTVKYCVENAEMNIHIRANEGLQPIHDAARYGGVNVLRYLISRGADVAATGDEGYSVLHFAALSGDLDTLKYCVEEAKLPSDTKAHNGQTVLHAATLLEGKPNLDVVKYCVEVLKMPVNARDNKEETAKDYIKDKPELKDIYDYLDTQE